MIRTVALLAILFSLFDSAVAAQTNSAESASSVWSTLSAPTMDPAKFAHTESVSIVRDHVHITLTDGTIQFTQPVNGVVFGAVFRGTGRVQADSPSATEAQQLRLFTKQDKLAMTFSEATFSFTDGLVEEVAKQAKWKDGAPPSDDLYTKRQKEREDLGESVLPRLLQSITSTDRVRTAFFLADLKTNEKGWVEIHDDALEPEEIGVGRWVNIGPVKTYDTWMSFPAGGRTTADAWKNPEAKQDFSIRSYNLDVSVTSGAEMQATAKVEIAPRFSGENTLVFGLDSNLRVEYVKDSKGNALTLFQARENKDRFQSYGNYVAVALPAALEPGTTSVLEFRYGGKRAIRKAGTGNYFCESSGWYPELPNSFAARANFEVTFRSPKNLVLVATGLKTSDAVEGNTRVSTWKSEIPLAVAGFGYGDYKVYNEKAGAVSIDIYANREADDVMREVQRYIEASGQAAVGEMTPSAMAKTMGIEMANTIRVFQSFYGPYPYTHLAVTSMPISYSYGQGWPGLIYLWSASFLDSTQRHALNLNDQIGLTDFFRAHESSHQWWGHRVGWKSYHDQWLSEGFAEFSGNLYVQYRENVKEYLARWRKEKELLKRKDRNGHPVESLGPIWMGQRIASSETDGGAYQDLIYSKGGYALHMLRMQLTDPRNADPDHIFKETMQDYCKTFDNKPASTEDFKAVVEKHMTQNMDLDGNHKMDWFFNQYVYGTGMPQYNFHVSLSATADGKTSVAGELTRSGVAESWKDVVPIYAHIGDKTMRLGSLAATHSVEKVNIVLPGKIDRISIDDNGELLADVKQ